MGKEIELERFWWAVFTPADCCVQYTFSCNRKSAINKLKIQTGETWDQLKKRGWYSAQVQIVWRKYKK